MASWYYPNTGQQAPLTLHRKQACRLANFGNGNAIVADYRGRQNESSADDKLEHRVYQEILGGRQIMN
jgi:hypothetical protein